MQQAAQPAILTINCGSSSLKFALFSRAASMQLLAAAHISEIGGHKIKWRIKDARGELLADEELFAGDMAAATSHLARWLQRHSARFDIKAIGHRLVQGGMLHVDPEIAGPAMLSSLRALVPLAPEHLPPSLAVIEIFQQSFPGIPQIACFDTAFHSHMPFEARHYALPRHLWKEGLIRYGFHGLSYEYVMQQLCTIDEDTDKKKIVIAHLGNGASMCAIRNGKSIDTTMGLTPAGGLVMSSRPGDLDPGVMLFLSEQKKMAAGEINRLLNQKSGLRAISRADGNMAHLLEKESSDAYAAEAVSMFCYQARKFLGALAAACGGLDVLVFTGGIGEHAAIIRKRICDNMGFMGIRIDEEMNNRHDEIISAKDSAVTVRIIAADEEKIIAQHTQQWLDTQKNKQKI